jgi:hypothetical protein
MGARFDDGSGFEGRDDLIPFFVSPLQGLPELALILAHLVLQEPKFGQIELEQLIGRANWHNGTAMTSSGHSTTGHKADWVGRHLYPSWL